MRRALLIFLAALAAAPASASVLVVQERIDPSGAGSGEQNIQLQQAAVLSILRNRGATVRFVPNSAMTTAGAKASQVVLASGTETHHATIHLAFSLQYSSGVTAYDPRVLHSHDNWPTTPQLWVIAPQSGGAPTSNTASDTTGMNDNYASGQAINGSLYTTGHPWTWKNLYGTVKPAVATTPRAAGYWRVLVGYGDTPAAPPATGNQVKNPDSLNTRSQDPDSAIVWMRAKSNSAADLAAAQVYVYAGASGIVDIASIKVALAMLDSLTSITNAGGKVFDNRAKTTRKHGLVVTAANRYGSPSAYNVTEGGGIYCPSLVAGDTCDVTNFAAGVDSIRNLLDVRGRPIRGTWMVDPESLSTPNGLTLMAILKRAGSWKFGLQGVAGTVSGTTARAGAAGASLDPFGTLRTRTIFPTTASVTSPSCDSDTGSVQCNVANGFDLLTAAVGAARVDRVVAPAAWDWTPSAWTIAGAGTNTSGTLYGGEDSLRAAIYSGGARAILFNPVATGGNVGVNFEPPSTSLTGHTAPAGWSPTQRMLSVKWGGDKIGEIALLGVRWEPGSTHWTWQQASHQGFAQEWLAGTEIGKYYLIDAGVYYRHTFSVGTRVFGTQAGMLGGPRGNPWPQRPGYWQIKWLQHGFNAANAHLPEWSDGEPKLLDEFD